MSTEWFLQAHNNGEDQYIYVKNVIEIFSNYEFSKFDKGIDIKLLEGTVSIYFDVFEDEISHLMISRPIKSKELENIIYRIMELGNFIFFVSDGNYPIMLKQDIENNLPDGMVESLGKPKIAKSEMEFSNLLKMI
jgi:hypothetical protein